MAFDPAQLSNHLNIKTMNKLKNKVNLIGRLGAQPEVVTFDSGKTLARFNLATNENYKDKKGEWVESTQWHTINTWGKTAERVKQHLTKGQEIILEGKLVHQTYETAAGEKRYATIIEATEFLVISEKKEVINK